MSRQKLIRFAKNALSAFSPSAHSQPGNIASDGEHSALPTHVRACLDDIEASRILDRGNAISHLRCLGLEDFALVLSSIPLTDYPRLSEKLPTMASEDITIQWTGADPITVMSQGCAFARSCSDNYIAIKNTSLHGKRILDFACGYGRFLRLFKYYSNVVHGVDAWQASIDLCRDAGFTNDVFKCDEIAEELHIPGPYDFISAFSIFTHLSMPATVAALKGLRGAVSHQSVLAITIRPVEYWQSVLDSKHSAFQDQEASKREVLVKDLIADHKSTGYAFTPASFSKNHIYGDSSMTIQWLNQHATGWEVKRIDRCLGDPMQRYVFLAAV